MRDFHVKGLFWRVLNLLVCAVLSLLLYASVSHPLPMFGGLIGLFVLALLSGFTIFGGRDANVVISVSLLGLLLCGEAWERWKGPKVTLDGSDFYRVPTPYTEFGGRPGGVLQPTAASPMGGSLEDARIELNSMGFRGGVPPMPKQTETRMLMLGGSTVFNGAPASHSIAGQLEQLFIRSGLSHARVYNWGVVSSVSGQELSLLAHRGLAFDPDIVIVYDGGNDVFQPYLYDPRPGHPYNWMLYEAGIDRIRQHSSVRGVLLEQLGHSAFLKSIFPGALVGEVVGLSGLREQAGYGTEPWRQAIVSTYVSNLEKMCVIARGKPFHLAVFLQPLLFFKNPKVGREPELMGAHEFQEWVTATYEQVRSRLRESTYLHDSQCQVFDLTDTFVGVEREIYWDFIHPNNAGNEVVAREMYRHLKGLPLIRSGVSR